VRFGANRRSELFSVALPERGPSFKPEEMAIIRAAGVAHSKLPLIAAQIRFIDGEVVARTDPRFSAATGEKGFWEPYSSLFNPGLGIFFLQKYDPNRIPVLFVPGSIGMPAGWQDLSRHLDPAKFQFWVFSYPGGLPLESSAEALRAALLRLEATYGFRRIHVIAHSVGGLVARRALEPKKDGDPLSPFSGTLVTIGTPWDGQEAAELGVKYAPAVIPSWKDLEVGSKFVSSLFSRPLAPGMRQYLGFTYGGRRRAFLPQSNDGTVSLASQLRPAAQAASVQLRGFNEDHVSVLRARDFERWLNAILHTP
jgi:pimeloyl-ACP methyl ester carboxylesterase